MSLPDSPPQVSSSLVSSEATPQPDMVLAVSSKMTRTADTIDVGGVGSIIGSNTTGEDFFLSKLAYF